MSNIISFIRGRQISMPLFDYLDMNARLYGYESYNELIGEGLDIDFLVNQVYLTKYYNSLINDETVDNNIIYEFSDKLKSLGWIYDGMYEGGFIEPDTKLVFYTDRLSERGLLKAYNENDLRKFLLYNPLKSHFTIIAKQKEG